MILANLDATNLAEIDAPVREAVAEILYTAEYGAPDDPTDDRRAVCQDVKAEFDQLRRRTRMSPTRILIAVGCLDAKIAASSGDEIDVDALVNAYYGDGKAEYIRHNMLRALSQFAHLVERLDSGLNEASVPATTRAEWVRLGLDWPPGQGAERMLEESHLGDARAAWAAAQDRVDAFLLHVKGLPYELRSGQVPLESVLERTASAIVDYLASAPSTAD